jgi:hypothetical protein
MARIRSIKPDFFTSEVITSLLLSARLTFIGLWTYVDDNGVGLDNERLIMAAIWPLEEDPTAVFMRTREDLMKIAAAGRDATKPGLVTRYIHRQRRLIHITSWAEHQKVGHPGKPRYPLPTEPGVTCEYTDPHEDRMSTPEDHGKPHEALTPEQGAGSREQGAGSRDIQPASPTAAGRPRPPRAAPADATVNQRARAITDAYYEQEPMCKWPAVNAVVIRAVKDGRWNDSAIRDAMLRMASEGRSVTIDALRTELNGLPASRNGNRPSTTDQRVAAIQSLKTSAPGEIT